MVSKICSVSDCERKHYARGLCTLHYERLTRAANPLRFRNLTLLERLERRTIIDPKTGCWLWQGAHTKLGYGRIQVDRSKGQFVHRVGYQLLTGDIPDGLVLDHLCRVTNCWNPAHLEAVTPGTNSRRGLNGWNNAVKTHCPHGHPYDAENTTINRKGGRICRSCALVRVRKAHHAAAIRAGVLCLDCGIQLKSVKSTRCPSCSVKFSRSQRPRRAS